MSVILPFLSFEWFFNGVELSRSSQEGVAINTFDEFTSSLSFPNLKTSHSGNYTCVAANAAAKAYHSATLMVNSKPEKTHLIFAQTKLLVGIIS